ncbi:MAG: methyltransferase domain-containing protein [Smithellaceae bacterium]
MRESVKDFVNVAVNLVIPPEPIYEFGSYLVEDQQELANLRPLFPNRQYIGCDMREGPGVDLVLNLHDIALDDGVAGTVLCLDTLEHVEYPRKAMSEIHRILQPDGWVIISSVMNYAIHDHPFDYWRFTPEAFRSLLKDFPRQYVHFAGRDDFPHTIVGIGCKGHGLNPDAFWEAGLAWQRRWTEPEPPKTLGGKIQREARRIGRQAIGLFRR